MTPTMNKNVKCLYSHVATSRILQAITSVIGLHGFISLKSHIIRLHEDYSLVKVVTMVTKFYALKKNIDSGVNFLGYLCSVVSVL